MALREKRIETRSWQTPYRGLVAIAASKAWDRESRAWALADPACRTVWSKHGVTSLDQLPCGAIVAVGRLVGCVPTETVLQVAASMPPLLPYELEFGNYERGRFAWIFENVRTPSAPIPVRGSLGLYALPPDVFAALDAQGLAA